MWLLDIMSFSPRYFSQQVSYILNGPAYLLRPTMDLLLLFVSNFSSLPFTLASKQLATHFSQPATPIPRDDSGHSYETAFSGAIAYTSDLRTLVGTRFAHRDSSIEQCVGAISIIKRVVKTVKRN